MKKLISKKAGKVLVCAIIFIIFKQTLAIAQKNTPNSKIETSQDNQKDNINKEAANTLKIKNFKVTRTRSPYHVSGSIEYDEKGRVVKYKEEYENPKNNKVIEYSYESPSYILKKTNVGGERKLQELYKLNSSGFIEYFYIEIHPFDTNPTVEETFNGVRFVNKTSYEPRNNKPTNRFIYDSEGYMIQAPGSNTGEIVLNYTIKDGNIVRAVRGPRNPQDEVILTTTISEDYSYSQELLDPFNFYIFGIIDEFDLIDNTYTYITSSYDKIIPERFGKFGKNVNTGPIAKYRFMLGNIPNAAHCDIIHNKKDLKTTATCYEKSNILIDGKKYSMTIEFQHQEINVKK